MFTIIKTLDKEHRIFLFQWPCIWYSICESWSMRYMHRHMPFGELSNSSGVLNSGLTRVVLICWFTDGPGVAVIAW